MSSASGAPARGASVACTVPVFGSQSIVSDWYTRAPRYIRRSAETSGIDW
jgi:hypothetical protein